MSARRCHRLVIKEVGDGSVWNKCAPVAYHTQRHHDEIQNKVELFFAHRQQTKNHSNDVHRSCNKETNTVRAATYCSVPTAPLVDRQTIRTQKRKINQKETHCLRLCDQTSDLDRRLINVAMVQAFSAHKLPTFVKNLSVKQLRQQTLVKTRASAVNPAIATPQCSSTLKTFL